MASALHEIANKLGVSVSSVSRALSGKPGVTPAMRKKICAYAAREGLAPNIQAQALRTGRRHGLVLMVRPQESHIGMLRNALILAFAREVFPSVRMQYLAEEESLNDAVARALAFHPAAILVPGWQKFTLGTRLCRQVRRQGTALVCLDCCMHDFDAVLLERRPGMREAVKLLLASGCRHPVFMSLEGTDNPDARLLAVLETFRQMGRDPGEIRVHRLPRDLPHAYGKGFRETQRVIANEPADGLFCFNDQMAIGALRALDKAGLHVPRQVKVIGFDNLHESAYARVPLTTVASPVEDIAREAVAVCAKRVDHPDAPRIEKSYDTRLVVRESAPRPPGA